MIVAGSIELYESARSWYKAAASTDEAPVPSEADKDNGFDARAWTGTSSASNAHSYWSATSANPGRTECARQLGMELRLKALDLQAKHKDTAGQDANDRLSELFQKYGMSHGKIPSWKLSRCLTEYYGGVMPSVEELQFLTRSSDPWAIKRLIPLRELKDAMRAWELYKVFNKDIELVFYLYDGESSGKLEESQVIHVLQEICGEPLTLEQVMAIMRNADVNYDGAISRFEFTQMVVKWQALGVSSEDTVCQPLANFPWLRLQFPCRERPSLESEWCLCSSSTLASMAGASLRDRFQHHAPKDASAEFKRQFLV